MDVVDIKKVLFDTFKSIMLNKIDMIDSKMLNYWINSITNQNKTLDDFKNFVLKSTDYNNILRKTFLDIYYEIIGDKNYHELFNKFLSLYDNSILQETDILSFIKTSEAFQSKFSEIISNMFQLIHETNATAEQIDYFLDKFRNNPSYSIDDLRADIDRFNGILGTNNDMKPDNEDINIFGDDTIMDFTEEQQNEILQLWKDKPKFLKFYRENIGKNTRELNILQPEPIVPKANIINIVDTFEKVFQRNMNVREYLHYIDDMKKVAMDKLHAYISDIYKHHYDTFINVRDITSRYLDKELTEDEFISTYLHEKDSEAFAEQLVIFIVNSPEYKETMCNKIGTLYKTIYDECLVDADIVYIFEKVKKQMCDVMSEDLNNYIVEFKNETDRLTERIFKIYLDTFEREPDIYEISKYLELYRKNIDKDIESVDKQIEMELKTSLEYHDVIKGKIKNIYLEKHNKNILPSIVYSILEKVIKSKDIENVDTFISELVNDM
jgi:hypothetical protein